MREQIELTPKERELFEYIMAVVKAQCPTTTVRVAGGWVRDKVSSVTVQLISRESVDIDLALDNMNGTEFAALLA